MGKESAKKFVLKKRANSKDETKASKSIKSKIRKSMYADILNLFVFIKKIIL